VEVDILEPVLIGDVGTLTVQRVAVSSTWSYDYFDFQFTGINLPLLSTTLQPSLPFQLSRLSEDWLSSEDWCLSVDWHPFEDWRPSEDFFEISPTLEMPSFASLIQSSTSFTDFEHHLQLDEQCDACGSYTLECICSTWRLMSINERRSEMETLLMPFGDDIGIQESWNFNYCLPTEGQVIPREFEDSSTLVVRDSNSFFPSGVPKIRMGRKRKLTKEERAATAYMRKTATRKMCRQHYRNVRIIPNLIIALLTVSSAMI
jgi:hypothetical protein